MESDRRMDPRLVHILAERGVTRKQHETKMANLEQFGGIPIRAISHDWYEVKPWGGMLYNPYTNQWRNP